MTMLNIFKNIPLMDRITSSNLLEAWDSTKVITGSDFGERTQEHIKTLLSSKYSSEILEGLQMLYGV